MIWATWRQHRATLVAALGVIGLMIITTLVSTVLVRPSGEFQFLGGYSACYDSNTAACYAEGALHLTTLLAVALPVLLGVFVGVTVFASEITRGTHVLGLSQSVSRARWFWSKLLVVFVPIIVAATLLGAALQWSRRGPIRFGVYYYGTSLESPIFQASALVMGTATAFALILGATIALLLRRSLASMALTVVVGGAVLFLLGGVARPHYATPDVDAQGLEYAVSGSGPSYRYTSDSLRSWTVDAGYVDAAGRDVDANLSPCFRQQDTIAYPEPIPEETTAEFDAREEAWNAEQTGVAVDCVQALGADHYRIKYHLESRFWRFQITEAAILLLLAGALLFPARWGLRRLRP